MFKTTLFGSALFFSFCTWALDNPDNTNKAAELASNSAVYLNKITNATGYRSTLLAYTEYHEFLSDEIKSTYVDIAKKLTEKERDAFKASHTAWESFLHSQFAFIEEVWSKDNFGSASAIDRGQFKAKLLRDRLLELQYYQMTF
ncbi:hypothetical protein HC752_14635 [Vibrio sp. S9_S30]|uniref:lysozyme inhibitor LprI family protein n=1 Tax=Vibrio sp. S9_S30 TaxID=2720226 RepID=UPI00168146D7|nr:lysozyme inhibitor LprI family protein [Vibrio sp. S9_S30]MBD1558172.1 hypothetical protein [Vibrio sp. S9_S30]